MLRWLLLASVLFVAIGSGWLLHRTKTSALIPLTASQNTPDAYMDQVTALTLDKTGAPRLKITAPKMIHYATNDQSEFLQPALTIYRTNFEPWTVTAKYAKATNGIAIVDFWQHVILSHKQDEKGPDTTIQTAKIIVDTEKALARTNDTVTLIQPNLVSEATGLIADLHQNHIQLLSNAQAFYRDDLE